MPDLTSVALHSALRGLAERQRVIADNIANVQTPNFKARKVQFEEALAGQVATGGSSDVAPTVLTSLEPSRTDGNNVNLDEESLSNISTNLSYQLALRALDSRYSILRTSMRTS
jgi:flagellar basal-body rod protein FlgB